MISPALGCRQLQLTTSYDLPSRSEGCESQEKPRICSKQDGVADYRRCIASQRRLRVVFADLTPERRTSQGRKKAQIREERRYMTGGLIGSILRDWIIAQRQIAKKGVQESLFSEYSWILDEDFELSIRLLMRT